MIHDLCWDPEKRALTTHVVLPSSVLINRVNAVRKELLRLRRQPFADVVFDLEKRTLTATISKKLTVHEIFVPLIVFQILTRSLSSAHCRI
jgi:hypothetical protein